MKWGIGIIFLIVLVLISFADQTKPNREVINTPLAPKQIGPYSQGIKSNGTLYVSGQIGLKPDGSFDTTSIEVECMQALSNIRAIVEKANMKMKDVSKCSIYLTDLKNFAKVNEVYQIFFPQASPARETIEVRALPKGAHIEISVIVD